MADLSNRRIAIVVLGMHRSGTSALTRVLSLLGASLPVNLVGARPSNPAGHWEPDRIVEINDRMLAETDSRWDDWRAFDMRNLPSRLIDRYRGEIADAIREDYGSSRLFVLKDPRIARMVPLYEQVLRELGVEPRFVICLRSPSAVMESLASRDGMAPAVAALTWLRHVLDAEAMSRSSARSIVSYDHLMEGWHRVAETIARQLDLVWPISAGDAGALVEGFLSKGLQHHATTTLSGVDPNTTRMVKATDAALRRLLDDPNDGAAMASLDQIRSEFDDVAPRLGTVLPYLYESDRQLRRAQRDLEEVRVRSAKRIAELEGVVASVYQSRSWRLTRPLRDAWRLLDRANKRRTAVVGENRGSAEGRDVSPGVHGEAS